MIEIGLVVTILISTLIIVGYLFKLIKDDKLTKEDIRYIRGMNVLKSKQSYSKIEIQKAQQDIDSYLEFKKQIEKI